MRGTFFFVHGTGVRAGGWTTLWGRIQDYARSNRIEGVSFKGCAWYEKLGVPIDHIADTLPPEAARGTTRFVKTGRPGGVRSSPQDA